MLIVQDIFMTKTAELAHVVFPASVAAFETDGTVTNSERRVQRVRKALDPPGNARDDIWIIAELARRLGAPWPEVTAQGAWDELRSLSPMHRGMSWARLDALGGLQWPCPDEDHPGTRFLHARLWDKDPKGGRQDHPRVPAASHHRPQARFVQHRGADPRVRLAAARG
jgi:predicted molibdopterin-dependent oxidoreductase YjgC